MSSRGPVKKQTSGQRAAAHMKRGAAARDARIQSNRRAIIIRQPAAFVAQGSEIKAIDIFQANYAFRTIAGTPPNVLLNAVQTGAGFFNRVGSRIEMKSLHIRGLINNVATGTQDQGRIIVIYDRQPNGAMPVISDILRARDQTGAATTSGTSEINLDNRDRFVIVRDYTVVLPSVTNTAGVLTNGPAYPGDDEQLDVNIFIRLKGLSTHYLSTTNPATIADIGTGALSCWFVSMNTNAAWQASLGFRLRYHDV